MTTVLTTRVVIEAPAERVWAILTDLDRYPEWNLFTPRVETDFVVGHPIVLHCQLSRGVRRQVDTLIRWAPGEELRWGMTIGPAWLFRAERVQRVELLDDEHCRYVNEVEFTGLLSPFVTLAYGGEFQRGFDRIGADLARRAEPPKPATPRIVSAEFVHRGRFVASEPLATPAHDHTNTNWCEPVDKLDWQPCHACAAVIPVEFDEAIGTISYVCPHCCATQVGSEPDHQYRAAQRTCHVCACELGEALACPGCGMLRYWAVFGCWGCGAKQAVMAPHLAISCNLFGLECVACDTRSVSPCIC